jgi:hypothetical protein
MSIKHPCEQCGTRFRRHSKRQSLLCPGCRERRAQARYLAEARARHWLRAQHPEQYAAQVARARAQDPQGSATAVRNRARSRTLGELQRSHPDQYRERYQAELARAHAQLDRQAAKEREAAARPAEPRVPYWLERDVLAQQQAHANAAARLRALLWLADRHPDTTEAVHREQVAKLPLNPADRTPQRRSALAWAATLDRLARLHPADFEVRYKAELSAAQSRLRAS